jgi:hypothetical protein
MMPAFTVTAAARQSYESVKATTRRVSWRFRNQAYSMQNPLSHTNFLHLANPSLGLRDMLSLLLAAVFRPSRGPAAACVARRPNAAAAAATALSAD